MLLIYFVSTFVSKKEFLLDGTISNQGSKVKGISISRITIIALCTLLFIIIAFRGVSVGTDTASYYHEYLSLNSFSPPRSFIEFIKNEYGYTLIVFIFKSLRFSWLLFQIFYAFLLSFSIGLFIRRFSQNILVSFILFITIGVFPMFLTGLRQSIAIAFILISFVLAQKKHFIISFIFLVLSFSVHYTSLVCIIIPIVYLLSFVKKKKFLIVAVSLLIPIIARFFGNNIFDLFSFVLLNKYDNSGYYGSRNLTLNPIVLLMYWVMFLFITLGVIFSKRKMTTIDAIFYLLSSVFVACLEMSSVVYMLARLSYYFSFFFIIAVTNSIKNYPLSNDVKKITVLIIVILCSISFFISIPGGSFGIDNYSFIVGDH